MTRKIGVTARVVDSDGDAGEVLDKRKAWGVPERLVRYDNADIGCQWVAKAGLRLEQWTPAVGDRVRVINTALMRTGTQLGAEGAVTRVNVGDTYFNIDLTHPRDGVIEQLVRATNVEPLPVAQQPAGPTPDPTWAPVVGKYGMTRDGRKVLVAANDCAEYPFSHDSGEGGFHGLTPDGKSCIGQDEDDLIAEWPSTPVADVEATATKFKVGDRVVYEGSPYARPCYGTVSRIDGRMVHASDWTEGSGEGFFFDSNLRLATPTFSPGQLVTLAAPLEVLGTHHAMAHLRIGANSYTLPIEALAAA